MAAPRINTPVLRQSLPSGPPITDQLQYLQAIHTVSYSFVVIADSDPMGLFTGSV